MSRLQRMEVLADQLRQVLAQMGQARQDSGLHQNALTQLIGSYVMLINYLGSEIGHASDDSAATLLSSRLRQTVERIQYACESLTQASLGRQLTHCSLLHARDVIDNAISQLDGYARWKDSRIQVVHPEAQPVTVWADYRAAQECLITLLENAIKFSPPGSLIRLEYDQEGPYVVFQVSDSGPGVSSEEREHLFQPGFVGSAQATAREPRFGAGLAIARVLSEAMGGGVGHLLEHPCPGACFVLRLLSEQAV